LKENRFLSLVWIREKTQGKKVTSKKLFLLRLELEKLINKRKTQDGQDQTKQFASRFLLLGF